jgi:hypothetical protein
MVDRTPCWFFVGALSSSTMGSRILTPSIGRAAEGLARALEERDVDVIRALSFDDARSIVGPTPRSARFS